MVMSYWLTPSDDFTFDAVRLTIDVTDCSIVDEIVYETDTTGEAASPLIRCRT